MRRRPATLLLTLVLLLLPFCVSCSTSESPEKSTSQKALARLDKLRGGMLRIPLSGAPESLDPARITSTNAAAVARQVFSGLIRFDDQLLLRPDIAESWEVLEGGRLYVFTLNKKARFHNGRPVTAQDVAFSLKRVLWAESSTYMKTYLLGIAGAKEFASRRSEDVPGLEAQEGRILIRLEEPCAPFLAVLGMPQASIVPAEEISASSGTFRGRPIGCGPFSILDSSEREIRLARFSGYHGEMALLDEVRFVVYEHADIEIALADFKADRLDILPVVGAVQAALSDRKDLQWFHRPALSLFFYGLNTSHPALRSVELRRALAEAVDTRALVDRVYAGQFEPAGSILPPGLIGAGHTEEGAGDSSARRQGRQELRRFDGLPPLEVVTATWSPVVEAELEFIREAWARIGIRVSHRVIPDWSSFLSYLRSDAVQVYRYNRDAEMPDPDCVLAPLFSSAGTVNFMRFRDQGIDALLEKARSMVDPVERAALYRQIQDSILALSPLIPICYYSIDRVFKPRVQGLQISALGWYTMSLNRVWLESARDI